MYIFISLGYCTLRLPLYTSLLETIIWQQDGAPPHYGQIVRDYLDDTFVDWIGRRGTAEWPPQSI